MNNSYRLIYNEITNTWVAVSETAKTRGKRAAGAVLLAAASVVLGIPPVTSYAAPPNPPAPTQLPTGGQVVAGQAGIVQNAATLNVNQSSNRAVIDWASFNVGSQARVNFNQPGVSSVTLNRVLDANPSQIFGKISAPGQVFLTNPNGVYFAPGASVDVGALVATTHSISNEDFMAGGNSFTRSGASASVVNEGNITASLGGYVALLAPEVRNSGVIVAQLGTVALAAGEVFELQFDGNNTLANIRVTPASIAALVDNGNAVHAPGGLIILSAQALNHLQGGVVNNSGSLEASGLTASGGVIRLEASDRITHSGIIQVDAAPNSSGKGGTVSLIADLANAGSTTQIDGSISARGGSLGGDGGFVETSGTRLKIGDTFSVDTSAAQGKAGTWLLDPNDFTIAASGGDITGAALGTLLASNSITIQTSTGTNTATNLYATTNGSGDINVNDAVSWSANTALTLNAYRNININKSITASGATGSLALLYGQGAGPFNPPPTYNINAPVNLHAGSNFSTKLGNMDATGYTVITDLGLASDATGGSSQTLQGIARSANLSTNYALGGNIDASATSLWNGSGLPAVYAGFLPIGDGATNFTGTFDGLGHTISNLTLNRPTTNYVGLFGSVASATISNLGVVGGSVTGQIWVGGLMGFGGNSTIRNSYTTGAVTGSGFVGGLVGESFSSVISNSYATGSVTGSIESIYVGGLVGENFASLISNSYATGLVTVGSDSILFGGLVGSNDGGSEITQSFYDKGVNPTLKDIGNAADGADNVWGRSTTDLKVQASFTGWDFTTTPVWKIAAGKNGGYPYLAWAEAYVSSNTTIYVDLITGSSVYGNTPSFGWSYFTNPDGTGPTTVDGVSGSIAWSGAPSVPTSTSGVGTYNLSYAGSLALSNYTFLAGPAVPWYITARPITVTASSTGKTYGAADPALIYTEGGLGRVNGDTFTGALSRSGGNGVGNYTINQGSLDLGGNYSLSYNGATFSISPAPLTVTGNSASVTYNGKSQSASGFTASGLVNGDTASALSAVSASGSGTNAGSYAVVPTGTAANYTLSFVNGNLVIAKAAATVTGNSANVTYNGVSQSASGFTATGLVNGEAASVLTGVSASGSGTNAGSYAVVPTGTDANYTLSFVNGNLVIAKAAATVTGNSASKTYNGVSQSASGFTTTGLVNGETASVLTGVSASGSGTNAGSYAVVPAGTAANYTLSFVNGHLTVTPAPLTVTANNAAKTYDGLAYQGGNGLVVSGFVNGEGNSLVSGTPVYTGNAQGATNAGAYTISVAGLTAGNNYTLSFVDGQLLISKAHLTVTANDANRFVGAVNPAFSATLSGFVHGETLATSGVSGSAALSTSADITTPVGTAAIVAKQGSLAAGNYDFASFKDGTLTVNAVYVPPSTPLPQTLPNLNPEASLTPSATAATSTASDSPSADTGSSSANTLPTGGSSTGNSGGSSNTMPTAVDVTRSSNGSFRVALPNPSQYGSQFAGEGMARPPVAYMANGAALPGWLKFNPSTLVFSGVQPPGIMTIKVRVVINGVPTDVTLNFKAPNK